MQGACYSKKLDKGLHLYWQQSQHNHGLNNPLASKLLGTNINGEVVVSMEKGDSLQQALDRLHSPRVLEEDHHTVANVHVPWASLPVEILGNIVRN